MRRTLADSTSTAELARKRLHARTTNHQANALIGRSRREREMDDLYDSRKKQLKKDYYTKINEDTSALDNKQISDIYKGLSCNKKPLIVLEPIKKQESTEGVGKSEGIKAEVSVKNDEACETITNPFPTASRPNITAETLHAKLSRALTSKKKYLTVISSVMKLHRFESGPWLSINNKTEYIELLSKACLSKFLLEDTDILMALLPAFEPFVASVIKKGFIEFVQADDEMETDENNRVEFSAEETEYLQACLYRVAAVRASIHDDSIYVSKRIGEVKSLCEKIVLHNKNKTTASFTNGPFITRIVDECLEIMLPLVDVIWAATDVKALYLYCYINRDCFNDEVKIKIEGYQSLIKNGSGPRMGTASSYKGILTADRTVIDARTESVSYRDNLSSWGKRQGGVL